ncbi:MAG: UvrD-helicase domain-containing protein, partial [Bacillota bacterium]|nr:UvrD-helicase domain-containing protein [Bacillota bacterium]
MGVSWNDQQKEAITSRDADLLVSAAAGSGKTAVLVERVKRIIIEEKVDIDRILVVTFTKAAASEMKEKIIGAIEKELEEGSADGAFLRRQLDRISDADISTFHSFAFRMIRRYFQLVDVEPDFAVMEEGETAVMKADAAEQLFEESFESGDGEFIDFLKCYSSDRNDRDLKESIMALYEKIMATPEPFEWLRENVEELDTDEDSFTDSRFYSLMTEDIGRLLKNSEDLFRQGVGILEDHGLEKLSAKALEEAEQVFAMNRKFGKVKWDEMAAMINSFETVTMRSTNDEKDEWAMVKPFYDEFRKAAKDAIGTIKEKYMTIPLGEMIEDISFTYPKAKMLEKLLTEYDAIYRKMKKEQNVLDYNDAEHYALEILKNEQVRNEYREKFKYVFVDEYQDCNVVQDTLLQQVSSRGNLFMVGDVKQSIYKFRLAEPELFKARYSEFAEDESGLKQKIDLNMNYRSKENIIKAVNTVFKKNMEGYDDSAALYRGDTYEGEYQPETGLCLIQSSSDSEDLPEDVAAMKGAELEGHAIARIINRYVGTVFHDSLDQVDRKITFRDIVILRRSVKDVAYSWQQIFSRYGIPFYCSDSSGYLDTIEVMVFLDFLRLIDNSRRDVPLMSTMRSVIGGFSIDEMIKIRLHTRKGPFHEALKIYCEDGEDDDLKAKCRAFAERMDGYREMARVIPLGELIWRLMEDSGYFLYTGGLYGGTQRQANLRALVDRAVAFQNAHGGSIYGFLRYIDAMEKKKVDIAQASVLGEQDDVVRL